MKILCIDTSTRHNWIGLYADGTITDCVGYEDRQSCLINLMPSIKTVLENAQISLSALNIIAAVSGPGAWSSLRIGAATVKQLCLINKLPLFTISNHDLLAEIALRKLRPQKYVLSTIDAQSGKVYAALHQIDQSQQNRISEYQWDMVSHIAEDIPPDIADLVIVGDGAHRFEEYCRPNWRLQDGEPQRYSTYLEVLAMLAEAAHPPYNREEILLFKPLYIQPSSAEVEFNVSVT
jgi:tRNA threonylcarbamoyladenosine biosynthesis protein TsaB